MRRYRRPFSRRSRHWRWILPVLLLLAGVFVLDRQIVPLMQQYSRSQAEFFATRMINEAVTAVLSSEKPTYGTLVNVKRDGEGNVTSAEADVPTLNLLKSQVTAAVVEKIGKKQNITVSIPLGTLLGSRLFAGRGPYITLPFSMSGSVLTTVTSSFEEAGVNQTSHRIEMQIKANLFIAIPTAYTSVEVETPFIIAENVLLGKVPEAYTVVNGDDQTSTGQIFDYQSEIPK